MTSVKLLRAPRSAQWHRISYHLGPQLTGLKSCWLFCLEYHATESVPDTHSEYRRVETSASSGVGRAGPQTYCHSYRTVAMPSQCVWHCDTYVKAHGGYLEQHLNSIYM